MCGLEKWSRFSFRYVNFNVHMDLLNIFSSLWELISFGALALPGRTCLFCLTPELDSVLAILAKSCLGAVLCQMWVWKNGTPFHWVSVYTEVSWNFIPLSFSTYFSHTFFILFSYCPYTEVFPSPLSHTWNPHSGGQWIWKGKIATNVPVKAWRIPYIAYYRQC